MIHKRFRFLLTLFLLLSGTLCASQPQAAYAQSAAVDSKLNAFTEMADSTLSPTTATFPFFDDFEASGLGADWATGSSGTGRVETDTTNPFSGNNSIFLGKRVTQNQDNHASLILNIDLANRTDVFLTFWWRATQTANHDRNGVYISDNNGTTWAKVYGLSGNAQSYMRGILNLSDIVEDRGLTLNDHFLISFHYESRYFDPVGGLLLEDVQLTTRSQAVITFPASDQVDSTTFGPGLYPNGYGPGVVQISDSAAFSGNYHFFLGKHIKNNSDAGAFLSWVVDLTNQEDVFLDFWWRATGAANSSSNGVYLSVDDGTTWYNIRGLNANRQFYGRELINLADAAADRGLTLNNRVRIDFHYDSRYFDEIGGLYIDDLRLTTRTEVISALPTTESFSTTTFARGFYPVGSGSASVEISNEASQSAPYNLFIGKKVMGNADTGASLHWAVDLADQPTVYLDFWWRATGTANHGNNGVYISVDDEVTWTKLYNLSGNSQSYNHAIINLTQEASNRGITLNNRVRIAFHYASRYFEPIGGLRIDDLQIGTVDPNRRDRSIVYLPLVRK